MTQTRSQAEVLALRGEIDAAMRDAMLNGDHATVKKLMGEFDRLNKELVDIVYAEGQAERDAWGDMVEQTLEAIDLFEDWGRTLEVTYSGLGTDLVVSKVSVVFEGLEENIRGALKDLIAQVPAGTHAMVFDGTSVTLNAGKVSTGKAPRATNGAAGGRGKGWVVNGSTLQLGEAFDAVATPDEQRALEVIGENVDEIKSPGSKAYTYKVQVVKVHGGVRADS